MPPFLFCLSSSQTFLSSFYSTFLLLFHGFYGRFCFCFGLPRAQIIAAEYSILWGCPAQLAICCQQRCVCVCVSEPVSMCVCVCGKLCRWHFKKPKHFCLQMKCALCPAHRCCCCCWGTFAVPLLKKRRGDGPRLLLPFKQLRSCCWWVFTSGFYRDSSSLIKPPSAI